MIQLFLSRGEHDVCFVSFVSSFINQCYKPWPLSQLADTAVYINKLKHLNSIVLSTYWSLNVLDRKKKKRFCGWWVNQNAWKTCLQQIRNFSYSPIHVIRVIRYRRNTPLSSPLQQLIGLYFFSLVWKKQEEMLVSVSESLQSEAGSARDETNNQNISYNSPRDGNPIVKVKV